MIIAMRVIIPLRNRQAQESERLRRDRQGRISSVRKTISEFKFDPQMYSCNYNLVGKLLGNPSFLALEPYLSPDTRNDLRSEFVVKYTPDGHPLILYKLNNDLHRLEVEWGLV
jgi:hypothetical protein